MNARLAYRSDPRLSIKSINDGAAYVPKRQKRALGKRKGPSTRGGPDLTSHDESPRTSKPSSPSGELGFEGLLWSQRFWKPRAISYQAQGPRRGGRNVRGQTNKVRTARRRCRGQFCFRQIEITERESGTPPRVISHGVPKESASAMRQL